jgi:Fe-S-cluster containining protein
MSTMSQAAPSEPSAFSCNHCGACCQEHRVPLTHADLARLDEASASVPDFVEWLAPTDIDMEGEPETFLRLASGRRLLVLAHRRRGETSTCVFWRQGHGCTVYPARPASCRTYPFEAPDPADAASPSRRLPLHDAARCDPATGARAGWAPPRGDVIAALGSRDRELRAFVDVVQRWNRLQRRRVLGGRHPEGAEACLRYLRRAVSGA